MQWVTQITAAEVKQRFSAPAGPSEVIYERVTFTGSPLCCCLGLKQMRAFMNPSCLVTGVRGHHRGSQVILNTTKPPSVSRDSEKKRQPKMSDGGQRDSCGPGRRPDLAWWGEGYASLSSLHRRPPPWSCVEARSPPCWLPSKTEVSHLLVVIPGYQAELQPGLSSPALG